MNGNRRCILLTPFCLYLAVLTWIILFKTLPPAVILAERYTAPVLNLRPFAIDFSTTDLVRTQFREIRDNILLFVPVGLYLGLLWPEKGWGRKLLFAFGVSFACEAAQYTLRIGSADVTDLITNSAGALLGLALYQLGTKLLGSRTEKVFTVGALACTFLLLGLMLLLLCLG